MTRMMVEYPPYVNAYGQLPALLNAIKTANVPQKFNRDFLNTVLSFKSSSYNAMIPFFKRLGLIDETNVPTQHYRDFRDESISKTVLASRIKEAYATLFAANAYADRLTKEQVLQKLKSLLGVGDDDKVIPSVAGTFVELCKLGDFSNNESTKKKNEMINLPELMKPQMAQTPTKLGINYTINLNLPPTTDIQVFNAIFKSLKEHILNE